MNKINISGSITQLLRDIGTTNINIEELIGLPINDENGNPIGTIESIDVQNDIWNGYLFKDCGIDIYQKSGKLCSVEIVNQHKPKCFCDSSHVVTQECVVCKHNVECVNDAFNGRR